MNILDLMQICSEDREYVIKIANVKQQKTKTHKINKRKPVLFEL